jgi:5'-nucleotidase
MHLLLTNDDGINAPGLAALVREFSPRHKVSVIAPELEQTAVGHAITLADPIRVRRFSRNGNFFGHAVSGTPADCVKIALMELLESPPDMVVSGVNLGPNVGINVLYSGTVSAATEASILGRPALAVSLDTYADADFAPAARVAAALVEAAARIIPDGWPKGVCLNVNVPALPLAEIKGLTLTRQATGRFEERFDKRIDPHGRVYYWQCGQMPRQTPPGTDLWALGQKMVSITPLRPDLSVQSDLEWALDLDLPIDALK